MSNLYVFGNSEYDTVETIDYDGMVWYRGDYIAKGLNMDSALYCRVLETLNETEKRCRKDLELCSDPLEGCHIFLNGAGFDNMVSAMGDTSEAMGYREWVWTMVFPDRWDFYWEEKKGPFDSARLLDCSNEDTDSVNPIARMISQNFKNVRMLEIDGELWFVGRDVAKTLGYGGGRDNSSALSNAIADHVDDEDKQRCPYWVFGSDPDDDSPKVGRRGLMIINESGFYSLVCRSRLPEARRLWRWVLHEVLPSIFRHGMYITPQKYNDLKEDPALLRSYLLESKSSLAEDCPFPAPSIQLTGEAIEGWEQ